MLKAFKLKFDSCQILDQISYPNIFLWPNSILLAPAWILTRNKVKWFRVIKKDSWSLSSWINKLANDKVFMYFTCGLKCKGPATPTEGLEIGKFVLQNKSRSCTWSGLIDTSAFRPTSPGYFLIYPPQIATVMKPMSFCSEYNPVSHTTSLGESREWNMFFQGSIWYRVKAF